MDGLPGITKTRSIEEFSKPDYYEVKRGIVITLDNKTNNTLVA